MLRIVEAVEDDSAEMRRHVAGRCVALDFYFAVIEPRVGITTTYGTYERQNVNLVSMKGLASVLFDQECELDFRSQSAWHIDDTEYEVVRLNSLECFQILCLIGDRR